jgi:hypothetical protein
MLTKELSEAYESLPEGTKSVLLALSILINRIGSLLKADREDLFELLQAWRAADSQAERRSIHRAMEEILAQVPVGVKPLPLPEGKNLSRGVKGWAGHVGRTIRTLREKAGLTPAQLAERAGLPQSHISRLENAEHSATNMTLGKIAKALGVSAGQIDPRAD